MGADPIARYRKAWSAGNRGQNLPEGLGSLADKDALIDSAHDAGRENVPFGEWASANGLGAPASPSTSAPSSPAPTSAAAPMRARGGEGGVAPVFLGMLMAAMVLSIIDYGPTGPLLWFKAKFLNQPAGAPSTASTAQRTSSSTSTTTSSGGTVV